METTLRIHRVLAAMQPAKKNAKIYCIIKKVCSFGMILLKKLVV